MRKSLKDISWDVTEEVYREDPALSYSTLARYEREGFNNLSKLLTSLLGGRPSAISITVIPNDQISVR